MQSKGQYKGKINGQDSRFILSSQFGLENKSEIIKIKMKIKMKMKIKIKTEPAGFLLHKTRI